MKLLIQRFLALLIFVQAMVASPAGAEEIILRPDSINMDADWALSRVGKDLAPANSYSYPDTTVPVRLYLIDTAVANPSSFVAASNSKLTFEGPILVRGTNDPIVSTPRAHGTQLLSLIAGIQTGIAAGTPIHVVNYDIYPNTTTTISLLNDALIKVRSHHRNQSTPKMRAVVCIATSSSETSGSSMTSSSIDALLNEGIPVILSAGNLGLNATTIVPSSNGTKNGVICVGASGLNDALLTASNFGTPVDILAPGFEVRTRSVNATSPYVPMTGTSPAAALVAGAVLAELSINGSLTPAQVENAIKASAFIPASGPGLLRTTYASRLTINPDGPVIPAASPMLLTATPTPTTAQSSPPPPSSPQSGGGITPSVDADSDGISDMVEIFHRGSCEKIPAASSISLTAASQEVQFRFPIAFDFFQSAKPFELGNGYTWGILTTSNFKSWQVPEGSMSKTTDANGQAWLTVTFPASQPSCYVKIKINPPAPPP